MRLSILERGQLPQFDDSFCLEMVFCSLIYLYVDLPIKYIDNSKQEVSLTCVYPLQWLSFLNYRQSQIIMAFYI